MPVILKTPDSVDPAILLKQMQEIVASLELTLQTAARVEVDKPTAKNAVVVEHTANGIQIGLADARGKRELVSTASLGAVASSFLGFVGFLEGAGLSFPINLKPKQWFFWLNTTNNNTYIVLYMGSLGPGGYIKVQLT